METLGQRIGLLRRQKGIKQDEIAEILNVTPQAVSKWENDQTCPDIGLLPQLANLLGITVDELLTGKSNMPETRLVPTEERKDIKNMMLRMVVDSADGDKVRMNLPIAIVEAALDMGLNSGTGGSFMVGGIDVAKNVDFSKVMELVKQGLVGNLLEVESANGDTVRIFVE
ncbi:MAG: helix-turn-helix transcriptional regulator [Clostridia bacterium]|nr:helix-turn-helix transcriptional regulator [Clostridia bacterium]